MEKILESKEAAESHPAATAQQYTLYAAASASSRMIDTDVNENVSNAATEKADPVTNENQKERKEVCIVSDMQQS